MALRIDSSQNRNLYVGTGTEVAVNDGNAIITGNVGIGTTGPGEKLEVNGNIRIHNTSNAPYIDFVESGATSDSKARITMDQTDTNNGALLFATEGSGTLSERMRITSSGNVGIGTDDPSAKLHVRTSTDHNFEFEETGGELRISALNNARSANIPLQFASSQFNFISGNVGIGMTTSPAAALDIKHASVPLITRSTNNNGIAMYNEISGGYSNLYLYQINGSARVAIVGNGNSYFNGGNVGIGVTSPGAKLSLYDATEDVSINVNTGTGGSYPKKTGISFGATSTSLGGDAEFTGGAGIQAINKAASNNITDLAFWTTTGGSPTERMRIDSAGAIKFNAYGAGTLVTDASGNITASSGGGAGGPFLPLAGGSMSGGIVFSSQDGATCTPVDFLSYTCPDSSGTTVNAKIGEGVIIFPDNSKLNFGNSNDLQIYHDGSNSYINETGTGSLVLKTGALLVRNPSDASMLDAQSGGAINLYYNNSKKFETTNTGVTVTGDLTVTVDVGIGTTNPDIPLHVTANEDGSGIDKGTAKFINTNTGQGATTMHLVQTSSSNFANAVKFWQGSTPTAVGFIRLTTSATQFITSASDLNLKKNITNWSDDTLSKFKALEPKKFRFKTQDISEDKTLGFIAQNEVDNFPEAYPQFLGEDEKPYYGFNPTGMVPHLMKAIKDLVEKVETLENKITQLENNN